jgi:hypothetical protein
MIHIVSVTGALADSVRAWADVPPIAASRSTTQTAATDLIDFARIT